MQTQLNHVLTQGLKLDASGDWDQQANWSNRGIALWVRDDKVGSSALSLKEEETVEKGQAAEALAPAKRKSTGGEPAPKKKKTASKPQAAKSVTFFLFPRRWPPPITSSSLFHCACHTVITVCTFKYVQ